MRHDVIKAGDPIHPAWCDCSGCSLDRRRGLRLDLLAISLGIAAALIAVGVIMSQAGY